MSQIWDEPSLAANREGRIEPGQRPLLAVATLGWSVVEVGFAIGALVLIVLNISRPDTELGVVVILLFAFVFGAYGVWTGREGLLDLRDGKVESVAGQIGRTRRSRYGGGSFVVQDRQFNAAAGMFAAASVGDEVRLYFLPRTRQAVNFEPLQRAGRRR